MTVGYIFWLVLTIIFTIIEFAIPALVTVWFAFAAALTVFVSLITDSMKVEITFFTVVSLLSLIFLRPYARAILSKNKDNFDAEKIDIVLTRISNMVNFLKSEKKQIIFGKLLFDKIYVDIEEEIHSISKNCIIKILDKNIEILMLYEDFINSNIALNLKKKFRNNFLSGWGKGNNINEARHNAEKSYIKNKETNTEVIYLVSTNSETILSEINAKKRRILK